MTEKSKGQDKLIYKRYDLRFLVGNISIPGTAKMKVPSSSCPLATPLSVTSQLHSPPTAHSYRRCAATRSPHLRNLLATHNAAA